MHFFLRPEVLGVLIYAFLPLVGLIKLKEACTRQASRDVSGALGTSAREKDWATLSQ